MTINNRERQMWIDNDEGLQRLQRLSREALGKGEG